MKNNSKIIKLPISCFTFWVQFHSNYISNYLDISKRDFIFNEQEKIFVFFRDLEKGVISKVEQERLKNFMNPYFSSITKPNYATCFKNYSVDKNTIIINLKVE